MKDFFKLFFWAYGSSRGRMSRGAYNKYFPFAVALWMIALLIFCSMVTGYFNIPDKLIVPARIFLVIDIIFCLIGGFNVSAKRYHDLDLSAFEGRKGFALTFQEGTKGPNKYGPDPLEKNKQKTK